MLSIDDRIKVVKASNVFCRICLRLLGMGATTNSCGAGKHVTGNGKNTSCSQHDCENNVTLCKKHKKLNAEKRRLYRSALRWKQRFTAGQHHDDDDEENHSYLITVPEETETRCTAILNDMDQTRREIHLKQGSDMSKIFGYY